MGSKTKNLPLSGGIPIDIFSRTFGGKAAKHTIWLFNIAMENHHFYQFLRTVNHLFLWAIYTMAMLNNQRVMIGISKYHCYVTIYYIGFITVTFTM